MFGLLNSQIYDLQQSEIKNQNKQQDQQQSSALASQSFNNCRQSYTEKMKVTSNFIEKFIIKSEAAIAVDLKNGYETMKQNCKSQEISNGNNYDGILPISATTATFKELNVKQGKKIFLNNNCDNKNYVNRKIKSNNGGGGSGSSNGLAKSDKNSTNRNSENLLNFASTSPTTSERSMTSSDTSADITELQQKQKSSTNSSKQSTDLQRKKFLQMITFLDQQNQNLEKELAKEKKRRNDELSRIIKSLLCFEAKLKLEKKVINCKLYEKDDEIARLLQFNRKLTEKLKEKQGGDDENCKIDLIEQECKTKYPEIWFCPNCRKEFYGLTDGKEIWNHSGKDNRNLIDDHRIGSGSTEHCSSSDETLSSSFYGARRSIRYTSKRTFGTFRDYMRSRCMSIDDPNLENSEENTSTVSRDDSQTSSYEKMNYSQAIDRIHGIRRVSSFEFDSENENSLNQKKIVNRQQNKHFSSSGPSETDHDHSSPHEEDEECDVFYPSTLTTTTATTKTLNNKNERTTDRIKEFPRTTVQQEFEASSNDWYASASDLDEEHESSVRSKPYAYNAVNPVLECVNQILLQQSMEECINEKINNVAMTPTPNNHHNNGPISLESNENNSGSSSLNSGNLSGGSSASNKDGNNIVSRKRVHFSTKNSMVHVPRNDDEDNDDDDDDNDDDDDVENVVDHDNLNAMDLVAASPPAPVILIDQKSDNNFNYESIYSNEYEPIGSEHNSSNLYIDMDGSKISQDDRDIVAVSVVTKNLISKNPPALPPKPANLIKFKRALKMINNHPLQQNSSSENFYESENNANSIKENNFLCNKIEPDYCSISEVNESITVAVDVHKVPESSASSVSSLSSVATIGELNKEIFGEQQKSNEIEAEIFADIPKLPNVAAIIAPKHQQQQSVSKFINTENYITKTSTIDDNLSQLTPSNSPGQHYRPKSPGQVKRQHVPNILAEINKKMQNNNLNSNPTTPTKTINNFLISSISPKKNQSITASSVSSLSTTSSSHKQNSIHCSSVVQTDDKLLPLQDEFDWYNLDAEYGKLSNQPDVIIKSTKHELNNNNNNHGGVVGCIINDNLNDSIEYNLDEEFSLSTQPDILIKENSEIPTTKIDSNRTSSSSSQSSILTSTTTNLQNGFATIVDETPINNNLRKNLKNNTTNFVKFIDTAGLSTKPLPRQRKIYFSGPFV